MIYLQTPDDAAPSGVLLTDNAEIVVEKAACAITNIDPEVDTAVNANLQSQSQPAVVDKDKAAGIATETEKNFEENSTVTASITVDDIALPVSNIVNTDSVDETVVEPVNVSADPCLKDVDTKIELNVTIVAEEAASVNINEPLLNSSESTDVVPVVVLDIGDNTPPPPLPSTLPPPQVSLFAESAMSPIMPLVEEVVVAEERSVDDLVNPVKPVTTLEPDVVKEAIIDQSTLIENDVNESTISSTSLSSEVPSIQPVNVVSDNISFDLKNTANLETYATAQSEEQQNKEIADTVEKSLENSEDTITVVTNSNETATLESHDELVDKISAEDVHVESAGSPTEPHVDQTIEIDVALDNGCLPLPSPPPAPSTFDEETEVAVASNNHGFVADPNSTISNGHIIEHNNLKVI